MITRIGYNQSSFKSALIIGAIWVIVGLAGLFRSTENWSGVVYFMTGVFYFGIFITHRFRPYVVITAESLQIGSILPTKVRISEIKAMKYFAGEYRISTERKSAVINLDYVSGKDVDKLKARLAEIQDAIPSVQAARVSG